MTAPTLHAVLRGDLSRTVIRAPGEGVVLVGRSVITKVDKKHQLREDKTKSEYSVTIKARQARSLPLPSQGRTSLRKPANASTAGQGRSRTKKYLGYCYTPQWDIDTSPSELMEQNLHQTF